MEPEEINEVIENVEEPIEPIETVEQPEPTHETMFGLVSCKMLNVREAPDVEADVITVLHKDSEVMIDVDASTDEFYSVCTESGIEGFCMKEFINV